MPVKDKKNQKIAWFHKNRIKVLVWVIVTVIPLSLILLAYVGTYTAYNKVKFDDTLEEYVTKFIALEDLELISLDFEWATLRYPVIADDQSITTNGYYQFKYEYSINGSYDITSVTLKPVLQTNWLNYRSLGNTITLNPTALSTMIVTYNYELPQRTLLFINVESPILYLEVNIIYQSAGQSVNQIEYVKIDLNDYNPTTVID